MNGRQMDTQIIEIQLNGGLVSEKVDWQWAIRHMEKKIPIQQVFQKDERIDVIGLTYRKFH